MNLSKTIIERRSIRKYNGTPVEQELIVSLLYKAASLYVTEGTPQWRCIYYGTYESRQRLAVSITAKLKESKLGKLVLNKMIDFLTKKVAETPVHLVFIAESAENQRQSDENYASVCSIMQNFQLLGWEQGLGMLWYTDPIIQGKSFFKEIGLQEGERFAGILNIGYFDKMPRGRRRRIPAEQKWTVIGENDWKHSDTLQVTSQSVLDMLNQAIWAPNHGLRQPWRFIYVTNGKTKGKLQTLNRDISVPFLLVVAKEEADFHKREEDFAAISCLVQNFQLLAESKQWQVLRSIPEWIYDREQCKPFGIDPQERIVEVLELKGDDGYSNSVLAPPMVNITHL
ncbi:nitroreductase family protein [Pseudogracilibacillus sp. SO30301A]|uniref:nitroreductase family protein n=1 Tax=Pseudogracilibacillus sp. SO30301A TaxID=3098291 RepID=UPI00300E383B